MRLEDITPKNLDRIAEEWEENKITDLVTESIIGLGERLRISREQTMHLESKAKIRALRLFHFHNFTNRQIADLLGITLREVNKWLK